MSMTRRLTAIAAALVMFAPAGRGAAAEKPAGANPDTLRHVVMEKASSGQLTDPLIEAFLAYAEAEARGEIDAKHVPPAFWDRLASDESLFVPLLVALHPKYDPAVVVNLQTLAERHGEAFDRHPQFALAMAVVYARAGDRGVIDPGLRHRYSSPDRPQPTIEQSFGWYLKYERMMKVSLTRTPWPVLAYVADNDIPLAEREWALKRYGNRATWAGVYYDVPYDMDRVEGPGKIGDRPYTLANIQEYGGVCMDRAYYASRVLKSIGIPSMYDCGEGKRGAHAWVSWIARGRKEVELKFAGRFDFDKYYRGVVSNPVTRKRMLDREVQLLAAAMGRSYEGWLDACAACHVYDLFEGEARAHVTDLLDGAVKRNPYHAGMWRRMAVGVVDGVIPEKKGEQMVERMLRHFADYPDLTFEVLVRVLTPRLAVAEKPAPQDVSRNVAVLEKAFQIYEASRRPDLAVKLRSFQGAYLEAVGRKAEALRLYVLASERYCSEHYGFLDLFDRAMELMEDDRMRLKYLGVLADRVPEYAGDFNRRFKQKNPAFVEVVEAYVEALGAAGRTAEARRWENRLAS